MHFFKGKRNPWNMCFGSLNHIICILILTPLIIQTIYKIHINVLVWCFWLLYYEFIYLNFRKYCFIIMLYCFDECNISSNYYVFSVARTIGLIQTQRLHVLPYFECLIMELTSYCGNTDITCVCKKLAILCTLLILCRIFCQNYTGTVNFFFFFSVIRCKIESWIFFQKNIPISQGLLEDMLISLDMNLDAFLDYKELATGLEQARRELREDKRKELSREATKNTLKTGNNFT